MEEFLSPAFYLTPPMDTGAPNVIYINHGRQISNLELFTTLAHEGFPGHLYQTVYFGRQSPSHIRYLIDYSGYVEGWATYVEVTRMIMQQIICLPAPYPHRKLLPARDFPG